MSGKRKGGKEVRGERDKMRSKKDIPCKDGSKQVTMFLTEMNEEGMEKRKEGNTRAGRRGRDEEVR